MFELLFLLLPLAAAYGFYMGRNSYKDTKARSQTEQTNKYLKGIDFFFKNDQAKAVDEFIAYLDSEHPTFESTLALGNLFRQRGELDRAISLHTSLAQNETLEPFECELAQLELAGDFMSAGLLDRAEDLLLTMIEIPSQRRSSALLLVKLYEQERDFSRAIALGLEHSDVLGVEGKQRLSHYYCELCQQALVTSKFKEARNYLNSGLELYPSSVRIRLLQAEVLLKELQENPQGPSSAAIAQASAAATTLQPQNGDAKSDMIRGAAAAAAAAINVNALAVPPKVQKQVLKLVSEMETLDSLTGVFCLELLKRCFVNKADPHYREALIELVNKTHSATATVELCLNVAQYTSRSDAEDMLLNAIKERPNIKLFSAYMGMRARDLHHEHESEVISQLKSIVDGQIARSSRYHCSHCGFDSSMMFWQCPSCRTWDSMRPKQSLDSD